MRKQKRRTKFATWRVGSRPSRRHCGVASTTARGTDLAVVGRPPPSTCYAGELYTKQILDASLHCAPFGFRQTATSPLGETPSKRYRSQSSRVPRSRRVALSPHYCSAPFAAASSSFSMHSHHHRHHRLSAANNSRVYKRAQGRKQRGLS
uniref:Uncharacterized protein n=1 Tax=Plectus sambesii TaxID=2011161 RepID=A0A914VDA1_9BILA